MRNPGPRTVSALKAVLFLAALVPAGHLTAGALLHPEWLGANPAEFITRSTGDWALRFLLLTLAMTPARLWLGWAWALRLRRMLGLYAYFYACLHFTSYIAFDHVFDLGAILNDIVKRPFITVGFASLLLMSPLAFTSANAMVRWLGASRWRALHRLVYLIAPLAVLHFWWMVKRDITEPAIYGAILLLLLAARMPVWRRSRQPAAWPGNAPKLPGS